MNDASWIIICMLCLVFGFGLGGLMMKGPRIELNEAETERLRRELTKLRRVNKVYQLEWQRRAQQCRDATKK
jgi:hypothetical protein